MKRLIKTLAVLVTLFFLGIAGVVGIIFYISTDLPQISSLKDYNPPMNSKIYSKDGELLLEIGQETREVVPYNKIPKRILDAFLAAEDDNFFNHEGIDYLGILRAFIVNMKEGRLVQGGSTITQQVAKSFLLTKEKTFSRKIKDLLLARKIEQKFSKEEILFLYLNQVYLGGGYYGVKAAFKGYFDKSLEEASPAEAALVAGLLVAPGKYSPYVNPEYAKMRQSYVLKRMYETGKINQIEYQSALKENIKMRIRKPNEIKAGHFTDWVRQEVIKIVGSEEFLTNGFTVNTSLDWSLQAKADRVVKEKVKELDKRQGFLGALKNLKNVSEIKNFILDQRKKILKDQSTYFTLNVDGEKLYEFHEKEDQVEEFLNYFKNESDKISERFRSLVDVGNSIDDPFWDFLQQGKSYEAVVSETNDLKRIIIAEIAGSRVIIPESGFDWAHERKITDYPSYFNPIKTPSKILKKGDVILIKILDKKVSSDQLIHSDFFKKYNDPQLRDLLSRQKFFKGQLDQEPQVEGAMVALNASTGDVVAMVGGVDFQKSQFNRTIQSLRQPGSAFKPFIFAASLENGYHASSILMDSPQALGGVDESLSWKPKNYDGEFMGPMTLRNALEVSRNIPTIRLVQNLGVKKIQEFVERLHIKADLPRDMSLSLGSFGISLTELTKGYAIFPNGGKALRLRNILSITDKNGKKYSIPPADSDWPKEAKSPSDQSSQENLSEANGPKNPFLINLTQTQVYDPRLAFIMSNLLRGVTLYGTAAAANKLSPNIAGKTGTTNNYIDALFVGFTSNIVVGTWVGFDDNRPLGYGETGGKAALPMWIEFMSHAIGKYGHPEFQVPEGVVSLMVDKQTGKPSTSGQSGFMDYFVSGFDPNSDTSAIFDQSSSSGSNSSSLDDANYWENQ